MATPILLTRGQLERRFGAKTVRDLADTSQDGTEVTAQVNEALHEASSILIQLLRKGWPAIEQLEAMCLGADADPAIYGAGCDIAIDILARGSTAHINPDGTTIYDGIRKAAEKRLEKAADGESKPDAERLAAVGPNALRTIGIETNRDERVLVFQGNRSNPRGPGGF